jgi:hypothetical protein
MQSVVTNEPVKTSNRPVLIPVHISFEELLLTIETLTKQQKWQLYQALAAELAPHSAEAKAIARLQDEDDPSQWITVVEEGEEIDVESSLEYLKQRGYAVKIPSKS